MSKQERDALQAGLQRANAHSLEHIAERQALEADPFFVREEWRAPEQTTTIVKDVLDAEIMFRTQEDARVLETATDNTSFADTIGDLCEQLGGEIGIVERELRLELREQAVKLKELELELRELRTLMQSKNE